MKWAITRMDPMFQPFRWKPYIWLRKYPAIVSPGHEHWQHYLTVQWLWWQIGAYWRTCRD